MDDGNCNFTMRLDLEPLPARTLVGGVVTLDNEVEPRLRAVLVLVFPPMICCDGVSPCTCAWSGWR